MAQVAHYLTHHWSTVVVTAFVLIALLGVVYDALD